MSTIPLTLVEGHIALPRLRPLGHLPAPFGRNWALLPPGRSWRPELKALYAAVLRTFCMSDKTILSFCKWVPLDARRVATAEAVAVARATVFDAPLPEAAHMSSEAGAFPPVEGPAGRSKFGTASRRGASAHWGALAGGACAFGGAAMLAWIAFGHPAHRHTINDAKTVGTVSASRDSQSAERRLPDAVTAQAAASGEVSARVREAASALAPVRVGTAPTLAVAPAHVSADETFPRRRDKLRAKTGSQHEKTRRHNARFATANQLSHVAAMVDDMPRIAVPSITSRTSPRPSAAGPYSPLAPARLGVDEYAAVTMSASTHLRDIAPPRRPASSNNSSATSGTEWMNHLSQRRVTEIPDQFTK